MDATQSLLYHEAPESCEVGDDSATCQSEDGSGKHSGMADHRALKPPKQFVNRDFPYGMQICHTFSQLFLFLLYIYIYCFLLVYLKKQNIIFSIKIYTYVFYFAHDMHM